MYVRCACVAAVWTAMTPMRAGHCWRGRPRFAVRPAGGPFFTVTIIDYKSSRLQTTRPTERRSSYRYGSYVLRVGIYVMIYVYGTYRHPTLRILYTAGTRRTS